jgi:hypothetical protein
MPESTALSWDLKTLTITTIKGNVVDISFLMEEINIFEDIHNNTISADVTIADAQNIINKLPITGHETLQLSFKSAGQQNYVSLNLQIYKIDSRQLEKERMQVFIMYCIDATAFTNAQFTVSKAYTGKTISDIATDIQTNFLQSSFYQIEPTKNLQHIIMGSWHPFKCLNFLASRAKSCQYKGSNFVYFQSIDGFNFVSLEKLCDVPIYQNYIYQVANVRKDNSIGYKPRTLNTDSIAIQAYKFNTNFDTLQSCSHGMYSNHAVYYDLQKKSFTENIWDYPSSYNDYKHVEANTVSGGLSYLWTPVSDFNEGPNGRHLLYPVGLPGQENFSQQWLQPRISQMEQIQAVSLFVTVPGDSVRRVGHLVSITLPSPEPTVNDQQIPDAYYTGRYLCSAVRHILQKTNYVSVLELVKDSLHSAYGSI